MCRNLQLLFMVIFLGCSLASEDEFASTTPYSFEQPWEPYDGHHQFTTSRRTKDLLVPGSHFESESNRRSSNSKRFHDENENEDSDERPYNANLLNKFLEEYAEKVKNSNITTRRKVEEVSVDRKTGPSDKLSLKNSYIFDLGPNKNRYPGYSGHGHQETTKGGWVTMEAVPWSTSKISKWQSKPSNNQGFPNIDRFSSTSGSNQHNTYFDSPKPMKPSFSRPGGDGYNRRPIGGASIVTRPDDYDDLGSPSYSNRPYDNNRPYDSGRPYDRPELEYDADMPSRPYSPGRPGRPHCDDHKYGYESDIVTDGLPGNFPPYRGAGNSYDYPSSTSRLSSRHPSTYPNQGNGEWVLISASKGYPSRHRGSGQRSMALQSLSDGNDNSQQQAAPTAVVSTGSVKLTVLPPKDINNMTTSHGGMLEVESSHQSVDDSQRLYFEDQIKNLTRRVNKKRPIQRRPVRVAAAAPDSSAVLAAVGAGMVPATMAMAIPLLMGRRRRRRRNASKSQKLGKGQRMIDHFTENVIQRSIK